MYKANMSTREIKRAFKRSLEEHEYEGSRYASLSAIAREITGTRWSGPLFFGLKAPMKTKSKKRAKR